MENNSIEAKLEELIIKAKELGIQFKSGPATFETIHDNKIFHVLEDMSDDTFIEILQKKIDHFESKKFISILSKHDLLQKKEEYAERNHDWNAIFDVSSSSPLTEVRTTDTIEGVQRHSTSTD
jgi:hypothetical protein